MMAMSRSFIGCPWSWIVQRIARLRRDRRSRRSDRCPGQARKNDPTHCVAKRQAAKRQAVEKTSWQPSCKNDKVGKQWGVFMSCGATIKTIGTRGGHIGYN